MANSKETADLKKKTLFFYLASNKPLYVSLQFVMNWDSGNYCELSRKFLFLETFLEKLFGILCAVIIELDTELGLRVL